MTDQNCAYCMEGDLVAQFGIKICELPSSKVYLFKEQSHKGRVIVAHKKHVSEIVELTAEERAAYMEDINHVAEALHKAFHPQKINYGAYGDTGHHLHFHLVPKYTDGYAVSYTHLRAHETDSYLVCRLLLEKKKNNIPKSKAKTIANN